MCFLDFIIIIVMSVQLNQLVFTLVAISHVYPNSAQLLIILYVLSLQMTALEFLATGLLIYLSKASPCQTYISTCCLHCCVLSDYKYSGTEFVFMKSMFKM